MNFNGFEFDDNLKQTLNAFDLNGRLPHALAIECADDEKALELARFLTMYIVCDNLSKPCCECPQCLKAGNKAHADIKYIPLPKSKKQNSIDQIRELKLESAVKPNEAGAKAYVFPKADVRMSDIVQNAFLKLLEEPPQNVYFILLCENSKKFLDTVLSRVTVIKLGEKIVVSEKALNGAKAIVRGIISPKEYELLTALRIIGDKDAADDALLAVKLLLRDGLALGVGAEAVFDRELGARLARRLTRDKLIKLIELTETAKIKIPEHININLIETWLCGEYRRISWQR